MKLKNLVIALLALLFSAGLSTHASAQEWRYYRHYRYSDKCCKDDDCRRDRYYYKPFRRGCNFGWRREAYAHCCDSSENNGKYCHTYRNYSHYDGRGYYRYYNRYNRFYYDRYYDDNFRPQVDDNK